MDCDGFDASTGHFPFVVNGQNFLIHDDCLIRTNRCEVVRYLGFSEAFCVNCEITVLRLPDSVTAISAHAFRNSHVTSIIG
jgi:hypothetical protein